MVTLVTTDAYRKTRLVKLKDPFEFTVSTYTILSVVLKICICECVVSRGNGAEEELEQMFDKGKEVFNAYI